MEQWSLKGEFALSCNCTVFCPCVLSLGEHPPTEGHCQTWAALRIDDGRFDDVDLSGVKAALMAEIPGLMSRGNWTAALFVDDKASVQAVKALTRIFTGKVGGSTHLLSILVGQFPRRAAGADRLPDGRRNPDHHRRQDHRRRDHAGSRQGPRRKCRDPQLANTGSRPTSRSPKPTSRASGPSAATGILPADRPKSARSTGAISKGWTWHDGAVPRVR